ncbi:transcriptional regulator [Streptomyces sp. NPDC048637]|uniref:transcriptional regulator n=1 Tax=Streptomyces sp. NPDC048637 TaxID=3155636 RepID=UPI00341AE070
MLKDLEAFHRVAVAPYWRRIFSHLEADRNARAQIMLSGGIGQLLSTLHPAIRWVAPVLEVPGNGEDVKLEATGLVLAPAFFLSSRAPLLLEQRDGRPPILSYPIPVKQEWIGELWGASADGEQALPALVGRTRAAVLQTLTRTCTTTEVGERVGISTAAASQHTAVLRAAGLISTLRTLNKVQHTLTPLGGALLRGDLQ